MYDSIIITENTCVLHVVSVEENSNILESNSVCVENMHFYNFIYYSCDMVLFSRLE